MDQIRVAEAAAKDGLPRSSYAYSPTADPSSWRLPYLTAEGVPDPAHLQGSAAQLGESTIPLDAMPVVKAKLRSAYRRWGKAAEEWPEQIREDGALVEQALDWSFREEVGHAPTDDESWLMDLAISDMERFHEAWDERSVRRDKEGQFSFSSGGSSDNASDKAGPVAKLPTHLARRYGVTPKRLNTDQGRKMLRELRDVVDEFEKSGKKVWPAKMRMRLIRARSYLATGKMPSDGDIQKSIESGKAVEGVVLWKDRNVKEVAADIAEMLEASGDDHPYGAWRGGKASQGGGPASVKGKGTAAQRRSEMADRVGAKNVGRPTSLTRKLEAKGGDKADLDAKFAKAKTLDEEYEIAQQKYPGMSKGDAYSHMQLDATNARNMKGVPNNMPIDNATGKTMTNAELAARQRGSTARAEGQLRRQRISRDTKALDAMKAQDAVKEKANAKRLAVNSLKRRGIKPSDPYYRTELAIEMDQRGYREAGSDEHPYGPWKGGSKAAGGRPSGEPGQTRYDQGVKSGNLSGRLSPEGRAMQADLRAKQAQRSFDRASYGDVASVTYEKNGQSVRAAGTVKALGGGSQPMVLEDSAGKRASFLRSEVKSYRTENYSLSSRASRATAQRGSEMVRVGPGRTMRRSDAEKAGWRKSPGGNYIHESQREADILEASGDEHFFGSWKGGGKAAGRPAQSVSRANR